MPNTVTGLAFETALAALKDNHRVCRAGWNGKGMWLKLVPAERCTVAEIGDLDYVGKARFGLLKFDLLPWIGMKTADDKFVPWLCSQTDMLAEDWEIVE